MLTTMLAGFFSLFGFGLIIAFLGSIKLQLAARIGMDNAQFGRIIAAFQWVMVVMAIGSGLVIDNVGHQVVIIVGALMSTAAIFLIGHTHSFGHVMIYCAILGIGAQLLYTGGNTLLPALFADPSAGSNVGNAFFGLGALLMSIIVAALVKRISFEWALTIIALLPLIPLFFALMSEFPTVGSAFEMSSIITVLRHNVTWITALLLFCYIGLEVSMGAWITSFATELRANETEAARSLSIFLVAIMLSRLVFGLQHNVTGIQLTPIGSVLLISSGAVATVALSALIYARSLQAARGWFFLIGFAFGPIFPITIGMTLEHFAPSMWGTLFGVLATGGSMGAVVLPAWIGRFSNSRSVQSSFGILRGTAAGLVCVALVLSLWPLT